MSDLRLLKMKANAKGKPTQTSRLVPRLHYTDSDIEEAIKEYEI